VEEIWNNFKNIVYESIERFVPHKTLRKSETTIQAATCSQEIGIGGIIKINTKQRG